MIEKELYDISWKVDEPTYRQDPALSYSTLATYERTGFNGLDHLFDKKESPSLLLGSVVDSIITEGEDEFNDRYIVKDIKISDNGEMIAKYFAAEPHPYESFLDIPQDVVSSVAKSLGFWKADKWDSRRYNEVMKTGDILDYYDTLLHADKTVITKETFDTALAMVKALRESPSTSGYFAEDDEFSSVRRYYQLKFKAKFGDVTYRNMADLIVVDYDKKIVYPTDLKTSSHTEWDFEKSFLDWSYMIQARLYWRNIRANMDADPYFKDFVLDDYRFIVVNKVTLTPLVWKFPLTKTMGTLVDDKGNLYRDPFEIGKELRGYLDLRPQVPNGINKDGINIIKCLKPYEEV